jgi:hypothetical protein
MQLGTRVQRKGAGELIELAAARTSVPSIRWSTWLRCDACRTKKKQKWMMGCSVERLVCNKKRRLLLGCSCRYDCQTQMVTAEKATRLTASLANRRKQRIEREI